MSEPWVAIAEILAPHGVSGELRARPLGSFPERFRAGLTVRISGRDGTCQIKGVRWRGNTLLLKLSGIGDRDLAEQLRRVRILVSPEERFPLPEHVFYVDDLLGSAVKTPAGRQIGVLEDILENPANDLFVVSLDSGGQALVPAVKEFITVDASAKEIIVDPIPGLFPEGVADEN